MDPKSARSFAGPPSLLRSGPLRLGFLATVGVLLALLLGGVVAQIAGVLTLVFLAIFVSLGLYPLVQRLQAWRVPKPVAIAIVLAAFLAIVLVVAFMVVPIVVDEAAKLIQAVPHSITDVEAQPWFLDLSARFDQYPYLLLEWVRGAVADPNVWLAVGGGALRFVVNVANATFSTILVVTVTLYFVSSLQSMKDALYDLVPASQRESFEEIAEEIFASIGKYLGGQVILATIISVFSLILLLVTGVPYAGILAFLTFFLALIPVIGNIVATVLMSFVALFNSLPTAIIVAVAMVVYMQLEAYVLAPRIIGKAVRIPASLVLIGALAGAAVGGLLGALVAAPVVASILLIVKKVVVPKQRLL
ncbi:MAG TPA: AI-2E family transporter [Microbacteriaceae bacterium]|nr:AI-2E family transporter [Microbacteriaceae bacterium]